MKTLVEYLINEKIADKIDIDLDSPVMFSLYGDQEGPWYFGWRVKNDNKGVVGSLKDGQITYPKLIVDFDKFDPKNLGNPKTYDNK